MTGGPSRLSRLLSNSGRPHDLAELLRTHSSEPFKNSCEMALIGEASVEADFGQRVFWRQHFFAGCLDSQATDVVANSVTFAFAEDPRQMYGVNASFRAEFREGKLLAMLGFDFVDHAAQPTRSAFDLFRWHVCHRVQ